jgi:predicted RNA-binding Zn ribbon-like protein
MKQKPVKSYTMVTHAESELPFILHLPLLGGRPCLDFVNTIDYRLSPQKIEDTLINYEDLLAFCLRLSLISTEAYTTLREAAEETPDEAERAVTEAQAFRDALTAIIDDLAGTPGLKPRGFPRPEALAVFDTARRQAHNSEALVWKEGHLQLANNPKDEGLNLPWLILVRDAEDILCSSLATRVRVCRAEGCGRAFLDTSKNGTKRWCSMKICGNREKARRFNRSSAATHPPLGVPRGTLF